MAFDIIDQEVHLSGHCQIEEAEALFEALRGVDRPVFDLTQARYLHTSLVQLIMASAAAVRGKPSDTVLSACLDHLPSA